MKMLDRQEYDDLMSYLKPVFKKIWAHENDERQKVGKSLNAFQFGFPINNIWLYLTEKNGEKFYIIFNVSFFSMISDQIKQAQTQYPENFGTGNADDVMDALYQVRNIRVWVIRMRIWIIWWIIVAVMSCIELMVSSVMCYE